MIENQNSEVEIMIMDNHEFLFNNIRTIVVDETMTQFNSNQIGKVWISYPDLLRVVELLTDGQLHRMLATKYKNKQALALVDAGAGLLKFELEKLGVSLSRRHHQAGIFD